VLARAEGFVAQFDRGTSLESVEHDLSVRVEVSMGKGTVQGSVTTQFKSDGGLTFVFTTDQSYLRETLRQVKGILASSVR
jgi:hypothetical protein